MNTKVLALGTLAGSVVADIATTALFLRHGYTEANPRAAQTMADIGFLGWAGWKLALVALIAGVAWLAVKTEPRLRVPVGCFVGLVAIVHFAVAGWNVSLVV